MHLWTMFYSHLTSTATYVIKVTLGESQIIYVKQEISL